MDTKIAERRDDGTRTCPTCGGHGFVLARTMLAPYGRPNYHAVRCSTCKGTGRVARKGKEK